MKTLLMLLLMTGVCWPDDTIRFTHSGIVGYVSNVTYEGTYPEGVLKISCPDGYHIEGSMRDRNYDKRKCKNKYGGDSPMADLCIDSQLPTDAEIKCVKE
jgi:hypothetical protein